VQVGPGGSLNLSGTITMTGGGALGTYSNLPVHPPAVINDAIATTNVNRVFAQLGTDLVLNGVISGTGSIAYGRDERGRALRSGGWGTLFDDAGSGYDLGRKAIASALRAFDGRGPRTRLDAKICRALGLRDVTEVVLRPLAPREIAALFPLVLEAAREGDLVARELCEQSGQELAELALALVKRFGWRDRAVLVACAGGVFQASLRIRRSFARRLRSRAPRARVALLRKPPVEGALALARALATDRLEIHNSK